MREYEVMGLRRYMEEEWVRDGGMLVGIIGDVILLFYRRFFKGREEGE